MGQQVFTEKRNANRVTAESLSSGTAAYNYNSPVLLELPPEIDISLVGATEVAPGEAKRTLISTEILIKTFDLVGSLIILFLVAPIMILIALLIKVSSRGPVLYRQRRVGKNGKIFTLYKFRTMVDDAEKHTGPVWAAREDDRVTPLGRVLRRTRIDELPQLFNVLRGDMSLVGPRPERPFFVKRHKALQGTRLMVKPGITGLAQIRALYDLKPEHKLKYDFLYIQKRSFLLNAYIILKTVPIVLMRKGW